MMIGIRQGNYLVYQGLSGHGHALLPTPVLSAAAVLSSTDELRQMRLGRGPADADLLFREDSFDAVTRIRRGRLYRTTLRRPEPWKVSSNHELPDQGRPDVDVYAFDSDLVGDIGLEPSTTLIALGVSEAYTLWRIVHAERIVTGETLLTLRARSARESSVWVRVGLMRWTSRLFAGMAVAALRLELPPRVPPLKVRPLAKLEALMT